MTTKACTVQHLQVCWRALVFLVVLSRLTTTQAGSFSNLELKNGAYEGLVVKIAENVPYEQCKIVLENMESSLIGASQLLFSALNGKAYLRSVAVILPPTWPDSCTANGVLPSNGEDSDVTIVPRGPVRGRIYTQQSLGCGQPGDQIYLSYESLLRRDDTIGRSLVKQFAMYRYGVFEEQGYTSDPIYPLCHHKHDSSNHGMEGMQITGCSDLPIQDVSGVCSVDSASTAASSYNASTMVDAKARTSIMFAAEAPSISMFCDDGNHDRFAPTKHNAMCQGRSVLDVIESHRDFAPTIAATSAAGTNENSHQITDTTPKFTYKKDLSTRYVFLIENSNQMMVRESWSNLRLVLRHWALNVVPDNTELGLVLSDNRTLPLLSLKNRGTDGRDSFYSAVPYTPSDAMRPRCLHCSIKEAVKMLVERTRSHGPATSVIVVIAAGMDDDSNATHLNRVVEEARKSHIRIATITYPSLARRHLLNTLAERTGGLARTVFEQKLNVDTSLLSTYFNLQNALYEIAREYYAGSVSALPVEVHRRQIIDDGRLSITGSFVMEATMGEPAQFIFYTHNTNTPLIKSLRLQSPSQHVFTRIMDRLIHLKMLLLHTNMSEPGTWSYTVEPYLGNPQPHYLQVLATPTGGPRIESKFWMSNNHQQQRYYTLFVEIKRGEAPVVAAKVEVIVTRIHSVNGTQTMKKFKVELFDSGAGEPDVTRGDGVYSRYFSAEEYGGAGIYQFEAQINDNGNTAYTWSEWSKFDDKPCCGSTIFSSSGVTPIIPFQRVLSTLTVAVTEEDLIAGRQQPPNGKIGDLRAHIIPEDMKARISWTSPDLGGRSVGRYEVKYSANLPELLDRYETAAITWDNGQPFPLAAGSETTFTLDFSQSLELLDKPLYFAIRAYAKDANSGVAPFSNWVRVVVPSPPPPPTVLPPNSPEHGNYWSHGGQTIGVDVGGTSLVKGGTAFGLEFILPIIVGFVLLVVLLVTYCYFCVARRHNKDDDSSEAPTQTKNGSNGTTITSNGNSPMKSDKIVPSTISIVSNQHHNQQYHHQLMVPPLIQSPYSDMPDPHQVGLPIHYAYEDDMNKQRYSIVNQQEQQLIEELKQQQQHMAALSAVEAANISPTGRILSPFNTWSASQLLHEHERRHSPTEQQQQNNVLDGGGAANEHMSNQQIAPPPVPPLPAPFSQTANGYPLNYNIYGVHNGVGVGGGPIYQTMVRRSPDNNGPPPPPFNNHQGSHQGSLSSVNSGDKKRRNVTMV